MPLKADKYVWRGIKGEGGGFLKRAKVLDAFSMLYVLCTVLCTTHNALGVASGHLLICPKHENDKRALVFII